MNWDAVVNTFLHEDLCKAAEHSCLKHLVASEV